MLSLFLFITCDAIIVSYSFFCHYFGIVIEECTLDNFSSILLSSRALDIK